MKVKVTITGFGKNFALVTEKEIQVMLDADIARIAKECEKIIQETIMTKSEMPTGKLASHWKAEEIQGGWGIGDVQELDDNVPYWNHIDKGSEGIGANWEHYLPRGFWSNGRWVESSNGFLGIKPKTPIPAMNYIASSLAKLDILIPSILKGNK